MSLLTHQALEDLIATREGPCVSLYMPTHRRGKDVDQDPIRLKNLIRLATERIVERGHSKSTAEKILAPAQKLLDDPYFWRHGSDGLAMFLEAGNIAHYRLPVEFSELVVVTDRYHVKPLLPFLSGDGRFYILAFSKAEVRLFQASRQAIGEIDMGNFSEGMRAVFDEEKYQKHLQHHTGGKARGEREGIIHAAGGSDREEREALARYCRQLDATVRDMIGREQAPLILAGVDYLHPIYREVSKYSQLVVEGITGNHDDTSLEDLHNDAWVIVEPIFLKNQRRLWTRFGEEFGAGKPTASTNIEDIVKASVEGRVDTLFFARDRYCWGNFDESNHNVTLFERKEIGGRDLINFSAVNTLFRDGQVFGFNADDLPKGTALAALFRY